MTDITITPKACHHLTKQLEKSPQTWLRLSLREAGCSGLEYLWSPTSAPQTDDLQIDTGDHSLQICVDNHDYQRALKGLTIDFAQDQLSSALTYRNPNQNGTCGCGVSFTVN